MKLSPEERDGQLVLEDVVLDGETLTSFSFAEVREGRELVVRRVSLARCRTHPGASLISGNVSLIDVRLDDFDCGDAIRVKTSGRIERVTIAGARPPAIDVVVTSAPSPEASARGGWCLDLRDYLGTVTVIGLGAAEVRRAPDRHVAIDVAALGGRKLRDLGVGPTSYWKILTTKVALAGAQLGVFSLPEPSSIGHAAKRELDVLREHGVCVLDER